MVSLHPKISDDFIKTFALDDKHIQELGQIIRTPKSRKILEILNGKEMHNKEIGKILDQDDNPRLSNLTHHLKKMTRVGLLKATLKQKNGHQIYYYTASPYILIVPNGDIEIAKKSKTLKWAFRKVFKISTLVLPIVYLSNFLSSRGSLDALPYMSADYAHAFDCRGTFPPFLDQLVNYIDSDFCAQIPYNEFSLFFTSIPLIVSGSLLWVHYNFFLRKKQLQY